MWLARSVEDLSATVDESLLDGLAVPIERQMSLKTYGSELSMSFENAGRVRSPVPVDLVEMPSYVYELQERDLGYRYVGPRVLRHWMESAYQLDGESLLSWYLTDVPSCRESIARLTGDTDPDTSGIQSLKGDTFTNCGRLTAGTEAARCYFETEPRDRRSGPQGSPAATVIIPYETIARLDIMLRYYTGPALFDKREKKRRLRARGYGSLDQVWITIHANDGWRMTQTQPRATCDPDAEDTTIAQIAALVRTVAEHRVGVHGASTPALDALIRCPPVYPPPQKRQELIGSVLVSELTVDFDRAIVYGLHQVPWQADSSIERR